MALDWGAGRGTVNVGGKALEWAVHGPAPDARHPVIVLLHEGLGCLMLWRDFPALLSKETGLPVFVFSRAGYGRSDPDDLPRPLDYMTREAVGRLPAVLNALRAERVILLGHSDGATIAAEYAGRMSDPRVRGLILMAPHFFAEEMGLAEIAKAKVAFETTDLPEKMGRYHRDAQATFRGWNDAWLAPGFKAWNVAEVLDDIRVPVLVIQGQQDQYGTIAQVEAVETRCPAPVETLMLDECRHAPQFDQPVRVRAGIADFASRLQRIERAETEPT